MPYQAAWEGGWLVGGEGGVWCGTHPSPRDGGGKVVGVEVPDMVPGAVDGLCVLLLEGAGPTKERKQGQHTFYHPRAGGT